MNLKKVKLLTQGSSQNIAASSRLVVQTKVEVSESHYFEAYIIF